MPLLLVLYLAIIVPLASRAVILPLRRLNVRQASTVSVQPLHVQHALLAHMPVLFKLLGAFLAPKAFNAWMPVLTL